MAVYALWSTLLSAPSVQRPIRVERCHHGTGSQEGPSLDIVPFRVHRDGAAEGVDLETHRDDALKEATQG